MPQLQENYDNLADPEAREKTKQALDTLTRVGNVKDGKIPEVSTDGDLETVKTKLKEILSHKHKHAIEKFGPVIEYIAGIGGQLVDEKETEPISWTTNCQSYIIAMIGEADAPAIVETLRKRATPGAAEADEVDLDDEDGEDLCNCTFNLAYGAKILLNQT
ncbi:translational elongation factor EF-1 alpha, partial [Friedmanniomyces endolithicus]